MQKRTLLKAIVGAAVISGLSLGTVSTAVAGDFKVVKIGVVGEYNAQWDTVNALLAKDKIRVKLVKFSDYATPNRALHDGDIDLNAFQHKAFLANDIARNGYKIVDIGDTIIAPLAIFNNKFKIKSIKDLKDGDIVAIPSDLTNGGRAIKLLEAAGLLKADPAKGFVPSKVDIIEYKVKIKIREAESGILARLLPDFSAALINGGNAYTAGLSLTKDAIFVEDINPKTNPNLGKLVNVIAAREKDKDNPVYRKIVKAYQTQETAQTIRSAYRGAFSVAWEGADQYKYKD